MPGFVIVWSELCALISQPKYSEILGTNGSKMCQNWSKNDSKLPLGGFLGPLLEALGALWVPRGAPMLKKYEKGRCLHQFSGPHFGAFLVIFRDFMLFGGCFFWVFVFEPFGDSIFTVLGIIFECFFDVFWVVFLLKRGS